MSQEPQQFGGYRGLPEHQEGSWHWRKDLIERYKFNEGKPQYPFTMSSIAFSSKIGFVKIHKGIKEKDGSEIYKIELMNSHQHVTPHLIFGEAREPKEFDVDNLRKDYGLTLDELIESLTLPPTLNEDAVMIKPEDRIKKLKKIFKAGYHKDDKSYLRFGLTKHGLCLIKNDKSVGPATLYLDDKGLEIDLDKKNGKIKKIMSQTRPVTTREATQEDENLVDEVLATFTSGLEEKPADKPEASATTVEEPIAKRKGWLRSKIDSINPWAA